MNRHSQIHSSTANYCSMPFQARIKDDIFGTFYDVSNIIPIDNYFGQPQNLRNGCVDTSPLALQSQSAAAHIMSVPPERPLPANLTDEDIHGMVISRYCQTPSELQQLTKYRPVEPSSEDKTDTTVEPIVEPSVNPSVSSD